MSFYIISAQKNLNNFYNFRALLKFNIIWNWKGIFINPLIPND